ncbi:MAG TPA: hypothetical protein VMS87_05960 [Roseiarcus sp.]|nr:hypothetical protein [Roseiarcus sp.]
MSHDLAAQVLQASGHFSGLDVGRRTGGYLLDAVRQICEGSRYLVDLAVQSVDVVCRDLNDFRAEFARFFKWFSVSMRVAR